MVGSAAWRQHKRDLDLAKRIMAKKKDRTGRGGIYLPHAHEKTQRKTIAPTAENAESVIAFLKTATQKPDYIAEIKRLYGQLTDVISRHCPDVTDAIRSRGFDVMKFLEAERDARYEYRSHKTADGACTFEVSTDVPEVVHDSFQLADTIEDALTFLASDSHDIETA